MAVIWWAFGWRVLAVALLVFATNFPSRFYWTGGGFLRWDWLFHLVAAICCLASASGRCWPARRWRIRPCCASFPGSSLPGPLFALRMARPAPTRRLDPAAPALLCRRGAGLALLVPLSLQVSGGVEGYRRFVQNTMKHQETPMTNLMGLQTVLAYRPSEVGRLTQDNRLMDSWGPWKDARKRAWRQAQPICVVCVLGFLSCWRGPRAAPRSGSRPPSGVTLIPWGWS